MGLEICFETFVQYVCHARDIYMQVKYRRQGREKVVPKSSFAFWERTETCAVEPVF